MTEIYVNQNNLNNKLTQERACELFSYDPITGIVIRRISRGGWQSGEVVGVLWSNSVVSYLRTTVDYVPYQLHRIIWLMETGDWPDEVDHINHDGLDNCWKNLRNVTRAINGRNASLSKSSTSGICGVSWSNNHKLWVAHAYSNGKRYGLYYGQDFLEACCSRKSEELRLGYHANHGR